MTHLSITSLLAVTLLFATAGRVNAGFEAREWRFSHMETVVGQHVVVLPRPAAMSQVQPTVHRQVEPIQVAPVQVAPAQVAPVQVAPVQIAPVQIAPIQVAPVAVQPIAEMPVQVAPVVVQPIAEMPVQIPSPPVVRHQTREVPPVQRDIRSLPLLERPNRPFHIYGNTVRRIYYSRGR